MFFDDIHPTAKTHALFAAVILEELNPEGAVGFSGTLGTAALALQGLAAGALDGRMALLAGSNRATGRTDLYASYNYGDANRGASGYQPKFGFNAQVLTVGGDVRVSDGFFAGAAIDTGRLNAAVKGGRGSFEMDGQTGRVYGVWRGGPVSLLIDADYGVLTTKNIRRTTAFAGFQTIGKAGGDHWGAGLKLAWTAELAGATLRPWAGVRTERVKLDAYHERDVASLNLDLDAQEAKSSSGAIGVDASTATKLGGRDLRFDFRAAWHGELTNKNRNVSGKLANNFTHTTSVALEDGDGKGLELGGAATLMFAKNWSTALGYYGDIRSGEKLASRATLSLQTGF